MLREGQLVHSESYRDTVTVAGNDLLKSTNLSNGASLIALGNGAPICHELRPFGGYCERLTTIISDEIKLNRVQGIVLLCEGTEIRTARHRSVSRSLEPHFSIATFPHALIATVGSTGIKPDTM